AAHEARQGRRSAQERRRALDVRTGTGVGVTAHRDGGAGVAEREVPSRDAADRNADLYDSGSSRADLCTCEHGVGAGQLAYAIAAILARLHGNAPGIRNEAALVDHYLVPRDDD